MPVSGTSTDYSNRTLDMYISTAPNLLTSISPFIYYSFGTPTKYIAGVEKLAQRFIIALMNSGFVEAVLASNQSNMQQAEHVFNLYSWDVISEFRTYQNENSGPSDERLLTVQLIGASTSPAPNGMPGVSLNFQTQLLTEAGNTVQFLLPVALL